MKSKKCNHLNGTLFEYMTASHSRQVNNGVMETIGINEIGNIDSYAFYCDDCKRWFKYNYRKPQEWIRTHIANLSVR